MLAIRSISARNKVVGWSREDNNVYSNLSIYAGHVNCSCIFLAFVEDIWPFLLYRFW